MTKGRNMTFVIKIQSTQEKNQTFQWGAFKSNFSEDKNNLTYFHQIYFQPVVVDDD